MSEKLFYLVAGPAGVGKTTLLARMVAEEKRLVKAVSVTTRAPRPGEVDGVSYHFWDEARFEQAVDNGEFLEYARVHGRWYGTLSQFVLDQLAAGNDVVKDIDVQGVTLMRARPDMRKKCVSIFIMPPNKGELLKRLTARSSESAEMMQVRLKNAEAEMARANEFDYIVINDDLESGLADLKAIRLAEHCRTARRLGDVE